MNEQSRVSNIYTGRDRHKSIHTYIYIYTHDEDCDVECVVSFFVCSSTMSTFDRAGRVKNIASPRMRKHERD